MSRVEDIPEMVNPANGSEGDSSKKPGPPGERVGSRRRLADCNRVVIGQTSQLLLGGAFAESLKQPPFRGRVLVN